MEQATFADLEYLQKKRKTWREQFALLLGLANLVTTARHVAA